MIPTDCSPNMTFDQAKLPSIICKWNLIKSVTPSVTFMVGLPFQVQKVVFLGSCGKIMLSCKLLTGLLAPFYRGGGDSS